MKKIASTYHIPIASLTAGNHSFSFQIEKDFFDGYSYSLIRNGSVKVLLNLDNQADCLKLNFLIEGSIRLSCDRCLNIYGQPVRTSEEITLGKKQAFRAAADAQSEILSKDGLALELAGFIYECLTLQVPIATSCEKAGKACNPDMLKRFQALNSANGKVQDPRWEQLTKLSTL